MILPERHEHKAYKGNETKLEYMSVGMVWDTGKGFRDKAPTSQREGYSQNKDQML